MSIIKIREQAVNKIMMPAVIVILIAMLVSIFVSFSPGSRSGPDKDSTGDGVRTAFIVNGDKISDAFYRAQLERAKEQAKQSGQEWSPTQAARIKSQLIPQMIQQAIVASAAQSDGVRVSGRDISDYKDKAYEQQIGQIKQMVFGDKAKGKTDKDVDRELRRRLGDDKGLDYVRAQIESSESDDTIRLQLLTQKYYDRILSQQKVTDADLRDSYRALTTRHILIDSNSRSDAAAKKRAEEVIQKLNKGADFATLAKQYSDDPGSKDNGGLYPAQTPAESQFAREYMDAALRLKPGEYTKTPVKTQFGYHIIKLESSELKLPKDFDKNKDKYRKELMQKRGGEVFQAKLEQLQKDAKITFKDPEFEAYYYFGKNSQGAGGYPMLTKAEAAFKRHIQQNANDPSSDSSYVQLAAIQSMLNHKDDAMKTLQRGLKDKFEDAQARMTLADMEFTAGKKKEALENYKLAAEVTNDPMVHMQLATVFKSKFPEPELAKKSDEIFQAALKRMQQQRAAQEKASRPATKTAPKSTAAKEPSPVKSGKGGQGDNPAGTDSSDKSAAPSKR
ncbi:MAG: peptidylprolyl isomerase [Armatimonadetes bacterium]|nr:peptidylprolyl isomerase [Armatimonadota bacterium]